jgi:hypothetical protein
VVGHVDVVSTGDAVRVAGIEDLLALLARLAVQDEDE